VIEQVWRVHVALMSNARYDHQPRSRNAGVEAFRDAQWDALIGAAIEQQCWDGNMPQAVAQFRFSE